MNNKTWTFALTLGASIVVVSAVVYVYQLFFSPNFLVRQGDSYIIIQPDTDFPALLSQLERERVVGDGLSFAFVSQLLGYQKNIKPGRYLIRKNANNWTVVRMLRAGLQTPVRLTFNNIRTRANLTEAIGNQLAFAPTTLDSLLRSPKFLSKYALDTNTAMVMFLPNTYEFYWNTSAASFIDKMHKQYQKFWTDARRQKAKALNISPVQVSILASIVQAETQKEDEKPRIAGVYLNRLRQKMRLDADPTLVFAVGDFGIKRVLDIHKKVDSPYNTYKYTGLPPGPINLPTEKTIDATLNAEQHEYIFFCAREDFSGYHAFAKTYSEHLKNARLYQKALDARGIK